MNLVDILDTVATDLCFSCVYCSLCFCCSGLACHCSNQLRASLCIARTDIDVGSKLKTSLSRRRRCPMFGTIHIQSGHWRLAAACISSLMRKLSSIEYDEYAAWQVSATNEVK